MKITICGSMTFAIEMLEYQRRLESRGHTCLLPHETEKWAAGEFHEDDRSTFMVKRKIAHNLIKRHYEKIAKSDAILVLNLTKGDIRHYIGANTFLEMGFAHILGLRIFLLHQLPDNPYIREGAEAMQPTVLYGNLSQVI